MICTVFTSFTSCLRANAVFTDRCLFSADVRCLHSDLIQCANINSCISSMVKYVVWLPLHAGIWWFTAPFRKEAVKMNELTLCAAGVLSSCASAHWWSNDHMKVVPHLVHTPSALALPKPSLYTSLTCHFCFKSPSLRRDYISTVKPAEIAFLVVLQGRSRERNENKAVFLESTWKWWQIEAEDS